MVEAAPPPPSQPAHRTASGRAQKAPASKPAKRRTKAATAGQSSISSVPAPAPAPAQPRQENVAPHRHEAPAAPTAWLPHPLRVRALNDSKSLAVQRPAVAPRLTATGASDSGCSQPGVGALTITTQARVASSDDGTGNAATASAAGPAEPAVALATPPQLLAADKEGWKDEQAARARGAEVRQVAFEESPVLFARYGNAGLAVVAERNTAAAAAAAATTAAAAEGEKPHAEHKLAEERVQPVLAAGSSPESTDSSATAGLNVAAAVCKGISLSARSAAEDVACCATPVVGYVGRRVAVTAPGTHAEGTERRSMASPCSLIRRDATGGVSSISGVGHARGMHGSETADGAGVSTRSADSVRVVNMAEAVRVRVRQSVQVKPHVRVSYSPESCARVVANWAAQQQVSDGIHQGLILSSITWLQ